MAADGLAALTRFARQVTGADFVLTFQADADGRAHPLTADPGPLPSAFSLKRAKFEGLDWSDGPRDIATLGLPSTVLLALDRPVQQALFLPTPFEDGARSGVLMMWGANRARQCECPFRTDISGSIVLLRASFSQMMATLHLDVLRQQAADRFHDLLETVPTGIVVFDTAGVTGLVNARASELLEVPAGKVEARVLSARMKALRDRCLNRDALAPIYAGLQNDLDYASTVCWRLPGQFIEVDTHPILGNGRNGRIWVFHDISARARLEEELRRRAETDPLTGLPNRRRFFEGGGTLFAESAVSGVPLSLLMLDVDHFKIVNDRYGHAAGDEVLRGVSEACRHALRDGDLLARVGGEEFALLLPSADQSAAARIGERVRAAVAAAPITTVSGPVAVTISLGGAVRRPDDATLDTVLRRADIALYEAKRGGRNRVIFDADSVGEKAPSVLV